DGQLISNEQQIQAVLRSLPEIWDHMKVQMTHNDNVTTFEDISRHLELEDERLEAAKPFNEDNFAKSNWGLKRKRDNKDTRLQIKLILRSKRNMLNMESMEARRIRP